MSYVVKEISARGLEQEEVESVSYPLSSATSQSKTPIQSRLVLVVHSDKSRFHLHRHSAYQIIVSEEKTVCFVLYKSDDLSQAKEAFKKLQSTLTPLLAKGTVMLTKDLLKEIIVPSPLDPSMITLHLVEVMEHNPDGHPEWYAIIQSLMSEEESKISLPLANTFSRKDFLGKLKQKLKPKTGGLFQSEEVKTLFATPLLAVQGAHEHATAIEEGDELLTNEILIKFLSFGFKSVFKKPDETQTKNWLMKAVEKGYLKSAMTLTLSGVNTNIKDTISGDSALHIAVKQGNLTLVKLLLAFLADPTICNAKNETPLDIARSQKIKNASSILEALETIQKLRAEAITYYKQNHVPQKPRNSSDTFLLSLDGGGIKSFCMCHILAAIEDRMEELDLSCKPLPSYFDYFAGTSAGAIIAGVLLYGNVSVQLCELLIYNFMMDVFRKPIEKRTEHLQQYIKQAVGSDTVMADLEEKDIIITTTIATVSPNKLHLMTNYGEARDGQLGPKQRKVWEALVASSAAPTYFPPFDIFLDGGLLANNPTLASMADIFKRGKKERKEVKLGCVLSLGTGIPPSQVVKNIEVFVPGFSLKTFTSIHSSLLGLNSLLTHFIENTTQSNGEIVHEAEAWCESLGAQYYRMSMPLMKDVDPDITSIDVLVDLAFEAEMYILKEHVMIDNIAKTLLSK